MARTATRHRRPLHAPAQAPGRRAPRRGWLLATTALLPVAAGQAAAQALPPPQAAPTGGQVVAGQAVIAQTAARTTITQATSRAAIDWQQFHVGSQHTVEFIQPNQASWTLNRVVGPDPSVIAGRVQANGGVAIVNRSGLVFAGGAQVDVGALIASAAGITNENFMAGRMVFDQAPRPGARVANHGTITVADRGLAALVAPGVANTGVIRARLGRVALGAAETFVLDLAGDGLIGIDVTQAVRTAPEGGTALVTNEGVISAPGGSVLLSAHAASGLVEDLVRQSGRIEAPTAEGRGGQVALRAAGGGLTVAGTVAATGGAGEGGGRIALAASGTVRVAAGARIDASGGGGGGEVLVGTSGRGRNQAMAARTVVESGAEIRADATGAGDGGILVLNALERTELSGALSARGGPQGGDGGFVELSSQGALVSSGTIDLRAPLGRTGELLLDPQNIIVSNAAAPPGLPGGETIALVIPDDQPMPASGTVTAADGANTEWTRVTPAAIASFAGNVTLDAARDIIVDSAINKANAGLRLIAGRDIHINAAITVTAPTAAEGTLSMAAGRSVTIGAALGASGAISITAGTGSIAIEADLLGAGLSLEAATGIAQTSGVIASRAASGAPALDTALPLTVNVTGNDPLDPGARFSATLTGDNGRLSLLGGGTAQGDLRLRSVDGIILAAGGTLTVNGAVDLTLAAPHPPTHAPTGIQFLGTLLAQSLTLTANRNITQDAASVIAAIGPGNAAAPGTPLPLQFTVTGSGHAIGLGSANNGALNLVAGSAEAGDVLLRGGAITVSGPVTAGTSGARNLLTLTSAGDVAIGGVLTARNLAIHADGAVTQSVALALGGTGGAGDNGLLTIRGSGGGTTNAGSVALPLANTVAALDARAAGALTFTGDAAFTVLEARGTGITLTGGAVTVANAQGITGTGAGDVRLVADSLTVSGNVAAPEGQTLTLRVDALDVTGTGTLSAGAAGTVEIGPRSAGFAVQVGAGGAPANTLVLDAADLGGISAGTLRIGRTTIGTAETAAGLSFVADLATTAELALISAGGIALDAANVTAPKLRMEATGGGIALGTGQVTAGGDAPAITLLASGAITQGAGGRLVAGGTAPADLVAHAGAGGMALAGVGDFTLADGGTPAGAAGPRSLFAPGGNVAFTTTGALRVAAAVEAAGAGAGIALTGRSIAVQAPLITDGSAGSSVALTATGTGAADTIGQTAAGVITAGTLTLSANRAIRLDAADNVVNALGPVTYAGEFAFATTQPLTIAAAIGATGGAPSDITLRAGGDLSLSAPVTAGTGRLTLEAGGSVLQASAGARITAGELRIAAGSDALLAPAAPAEFNQIGTLGSASVGGSLQLHIAGDVAIAGALAETGAAGSFRLETTGALSLAAGGSLSFTDVTLLAGGAITLGGTVGLTGGPAPVGTLRIASLADVTQTGGAIRADLLGLSAAGGATLTAPGNDIRRIAARAGGDLAVATSDTLETTTLGGMPQPGGAPAVNLDGASGANVFLSAAELTVAAPSFGPFAVHATAANGTATLRADSLTLNGDVAAGDPAPPLGAPILDGTIAIAPRSAGRDMVLGANDPLALSLTNSALARLDARNLVLGADAGTLRVQGATALPSSVATARLQGSSVAVEAPLSLPNVAGVLTLRAAAGDVTQTVAGAVGADTLRAEAPAGSVRLDAAANVVRLVSGTVAGDLAPADAATATFAFRGSGGFTVATPGIAAAGAQVALTAADGGSIEQGLGAPITAARLSAIADGAIRLASGGDAAGAADLNRVGRLAVAEAPTIAFVNGDPLTVGDLTASGFFFFGRFALLQAPGLTLEGTIQVPNSVLFLRTGLSFDAPAAGSIIQTGGLIRALGLAASAGGDILLPRPNEIASLVAGRNGIASGSGSPNSIVTAPGGTFLLARDRFVFPGGGTAPDLDVTAPIAVGMGGTIRLFTDGLAVSAPAGAPAFLAPGGVVQFAPFTAGTTIGLGGAGGLDGATYGAALVERVQATRLVLGGSDVAIAGIGPLDPAGRGSGDITLRGVLDLTGPGAPSILELRTNGDIIAGGLGLSVPQISAFAGGNIALGTTLAPIGAIVPGAAAAAGIAAGGTVEIASAGTLAVQAPILAEGASVTLAANDFALAPGARVRSGGGAGSTVALTDIGGTLTLGGAGSVLSAAEIALLDARGGTIRLQGPSITIEGPVAVDPGAAVRLELLAGGLGALTQAAGGTLAAQELLADAGSIALDGPGNSLPRVQATALTDVRITTDGAMELRGVLSALGGTAALQGTEVTLVGTNLSGAPQQAVEAGTVRITATAGDITGGPGLATIRATTEANLTAAGAITFPAASSTPSLVAAAGTGVTFTNDGPLAVQATGPGGGLVAGNITVSASALTLNDVLATGSVDLSATAGGITQNAGARLAAGTLRASAPGSILLAAADATGAARNQVQDIDLLASTAGSITLRNADPLTIDLPLGVGAGQTLTLEAPTLTIANDLSAGAGGRIVLRTGGFDGPASGGNITQTGGAITTPLLAALAGGSITLEAPGNAIGAIGGGVSAAGAALSFGLFAGGDAVVRSAGFGGSASLATTGELGVAPGRSLTLRADDFAIGADIVAPGGIVTLLPNTTGIGYALGGAPGGAAAGVITLDTAELARFSSAAPAAELRLGAAGVTGSVTIEGIADLTDGAAPRVQRLALAGDGSLTQNPGTVLDVAALSARFAAGNITLDPGVAGNRIAALDGVVAGGEVVIRGGAGPMALRDSGAGDAILAGAGSRIVLRADDLDIQAAVRAPGGTIAILPETPGRGVTLGGTAAGTLSVDTAEAARLGGGGATLGAPGAARLVIGSDGTTRAAGDIRIVGDVPLRDGATQRIGTLELVAGHPGAAGGSVRQISGAIDIATLTGTAQGDFATALTGASSNATGIRAGTLPAAGATGQVDITATGALTAENITGAASVRLSAGAELRAADITAPVVVLEGDPLRLTGPVEGSTSVSLASGGAIAQDPGAILATPLLTLAGAEVNLPLANAVRELGNATATGAGLTLHTTQPLLISGAVAAAGSISITTGQDLTLGAGRSIRSADGEVGLHAGGAASLSGTIAAGTDIDVTAGGAVTLANGKMTAPGAIEVAGNLGVTIQSFEIDPRTILLRGGPRLEVARSALRSSESIRLAAGTIRVSDSVFETGVVDVEAQGALTLSGGLFSIGRAVAFSAPAGIETGATITLRPRDALLPAVVFDVRAADARPDPLAVVQPDIPGRPDREQPTQVRIPRAQLPGDFGAASNAPGGVAKIDIDAGRSAIFLLLDGGSATGRIVSAGRLGIHGSGGFADLVGFLGGVGGAAAARFADATRPAAPGVLTRYRINNCVVSSVNCILLSGIEAVPQAPPRGVEIRLTAGRITDPDVMIPNVAEEDY